jgi:hypothetical protein
MRQPGDPKVIFAGLSDVSRVPERIAPGCGQTVSPCGMPPTGIDFTEPSSVLKA